MALPKNMRLKGQRTFDFIHKNSIKYHGKLMTFKVAKSKPEILITHKVADISSNLRVAIAISKKVSKKAVDRNKIRRILHEWLMTHIKENNNHKPYWLLVNLKNNDLCRDNSKLLQEFKTLMFKSGLIT